MKKTDSVKSMKQAPKKASFQLGHDGETHSPEKSSQTFEIKGMQILDNTCSSSLNLLSWNTSSMSLEKLQFIKQADIALLQEACWPLDKEAWIFQNKFQIFIKQRLGTPLATLVIKKLICERREDLETSNSLVVQVYLSNLSIFLVNIHLTSSSKKELKLITQKFENLPVIIGIDFNSTIRNFESFPYFNIFTELITRVGNNNKGRQIDYILVQKNLDVEQNFQPLLPRMSDHRPLNINIKIQQKNLFQIPIIKPEQIYFYLNERNVNGIYDYLEICNKPKKEFGVNYIKYDYVYNRTFSEEIEIQKPKLFSKNSKQFHKLIQHSKNLKPFKKEGSIMNCVKTDHGMVLNLCIKKLISLQSELNIMELEYKHPHDFYLEFSDDQLKQLGSNKKAVSYDLTELKYLTKFISKMNNKLHVDIDKLDQFGYLFSMRLVPLNKAHPNLPTIDEFRPIMVQSHFIKLVEAFFVPKFRQICTLEINPQQIGFVNKMACQYHIGQIIEQLKRNLISLNKLLNQLSSLIYLMLIIVQLDQDYFKNQERYGKYFNPNDLDFLEWVYNSLYIYDSVEKRKVYFRYGVHQGSLLAPFLFDNYFNGVIEELIVYAKQKQLIRPADSTLKEFKQKIPLYKEVKIYAYANDLAIVSNHKILNDLSFKFFWLAQDYSFKVNLNKTKVLSRAKKFRSCFGLVTTEKQFKYLGVYINNRGDMSYNLKHTKMVVSFIASQLRSLNKLLPLRHMTQMWNTYIRPHFQYISPLLYTQSKVAQEKWEKLRRYSLKLTLGLSKTLSNKIIDRIWELFDSRTPFSNQLKQYQGLLRKGNPYQMFLNKQFEDIKVIRRKRLKIQYFSDYGYLDRHKYNWIKCKTCNNGERWKFEHLLVHNKQFYDQYQNLDSYIEEKMSNEDVEIDGNYQFNLCSQFKIKNSNFVKEIEKHGIPYSE